MSELHWADALHATLKGELDERLRTHTELAREFLADALVRAAAPHVEAAYQRGLMAGRHASTKDDICPTCLSVLSATESAASAGEP